MKKTTSLLITSIIISCFVVIGVAEAATYTFSSDLKMGASGPDVSALQTMLLEKGFSIPSLKAGTVSKGYFGRETFRAVQSFQTANKLPSTGFVGPLTRGIINGKAIAVSNPNAPVSLKAITTPGVSGSLALSLQATPANGTTWGKGQVVDVATYKVQAGSSDMRLDSIQLDFNNRLWLYGSSVAILDEGNVIGEIKGLKAPDFTELTIGSSYRLNIPTHLIIPKGSVKYLTVRVSGLSITDRTSATIGITQIQSRAADGTGVTDTQTLASTRAFNFTGNNNGSVIIYADPQSPPNMTATISTAATTDNIVIGVADFKSEGKDGIMRTITLYFNANFDLSSNAITTLFRDIKIKVGDSVYSADSIGGIADFTPGYGVPVVFRNLDIMLPKDTMVPLAILVAVNQSTSNSLDGKAASTTLIATGTEGGTDNNPVVETTEGAHRTIAINEAPLLSSDITFTSRNLSMDYTAPVIATLGSPVLVSGTTVSYPVTFGFSITAGDNTLYVSSDPNLALATSSNGLPNNNLAQLPMGAVVVTPSNVPGDTNTSSQSGYYVIPPGSTRSFVYSGYVSNTGGTKGGKTFKIDAIRYGTSSSGLTANDLVYYNYAALKVNPSF